MAADVIDFPDRHVTEDGDVLHRFEIRGIGGMPATCVLRVWPGFEAALICEASRNCALDPRAFGTVLWECYGEELLYADWDEILSGECFE